MRRILAVATLGLALSVVSACADPVQETPGASTSPSAAQTKTLADKKTTCDAYKALQTEFEAKAMAFAPQLMAASADPSKAPALIVAAAPVFAEYETKLGPIVADAGDATVKTALDAELTAFKKLNADIKAAGTDPTKAQAVYQTIINDSSDPSEKAKQACGIEDK
ncbi:hypothetical protein [Catelliglobosispora koreensis]|uniref:hypothetical protein n=1 Tax=Catelliglobosispora koreensis TaxID=129052 RepID=UPI00036D99D7|nr:hypothetical protein [Catelliglobosispora koreensis]